MKKLRFIPVIISMVLFAGTTFAQTSQTLGPAASSNEPFSMSIANPKDTRERQFNFEIKPGSRIEDYVIVQNLADHPLHFSLYAANPTLSNTGSPAYKTRAETSGDGPGSWIKFDQPEVDLNANQTGKIRFTVNIPPQTPLGDYRAGLAMEKSRQDINNPSITINARFIIQTNIKVTNTPGPNRNQVNANFGWRDYYFWGSTTMFIISLALLIWITVHEKFHKKHHRQGKKHHTD